MDEQGREMDEQRAIVRLQQRDIGGLEMLVHAYQLRAVRTAYLITRDRGLAEEVVQGAFLRVYERIGQFDPTRPFAPWFWRIVVNDAVKVATRRERHRAIEEKEERDWQDPQLAEPAIAFEQAETRQEVWMALGRLPAMQRAVVIQRYYLGLSEAEMAAAAVCPPGTIKSRLSAARTRLRLLLQPTICI